jgi:hypothetical protein
MICGSGMPTAPAIAPTLTRPKSWKEAKRTNRRNPNAAAADIAENAMAVVRSAQFGVHAAHGNDEHVEPSKPHAAPESHGETHEEKHEEHVEENPLSPEEDLFRRKLKCWGIVFGVLIIFIFSTPFLWAVIDKPYEFRRQCVNPNYATYWSNLYLGWELLMILLSAIYAYYTGELGHIIHPVFIMLLMTCLFTPPSLVSVTGAHTAIDFIFNMPVKIVVGAMWFDCTNCILQCFFIWVLFCRHFGGSVADHGPYHLLCLFLIARGVSPSASRSARGLLVGV